VGKCCLLQLIADDTRSMQREEGLDGEDDD